MPRVKLNQSVNAAEYGNPSSGWRIGSDVVLSIAVLACDLKAAMEKAVAIWFPHRHE